MLLPLYFLSIWFLGWSLYKFLAWKQYKNRSTAVSILVLALVLLSTADHLVGEIIGRYWVRKSVNPIVCMTNQWSFFLPEDKDDCNDRAEKIGLSEIEKSMSIDSTSNAKEKNTTEFSNKRKIEQEKWSEVRRKSREADLKMSFSEFALENRFEEFEVDDPFLLRTYRFNIMKDADVAECVERIKNYFAQKYHKQFSAKKDVLEQIRIKNEQMCLKIQEIESLSERYVKTDSHSVFFFLGLRLHDRMQRRLVDSITGKVIYDRREVRSDGGWFVQHVLVNPVSGSYGRGYRYGFTGF